MWFLVSNVHRVTDCFSSESKVAVVYFPLCCLNKKGSGSWEQDPVSDLFDLNFFIMYCGIYQTEKNRWWFLRPLMKKETLLHVKPQIGFPSFELMFNKPVEYSTDWVTQSNLMLQKLQHTNLLAASCSSKSSSSWNLKYLQIQHSMKRYCFFILFGFLRDTHDRYKLDSGL